MAHKLLVSYVLIACSLAACGGGGDDTPTTGTVVFKIDAATCRGTSANMRFFVNGSLVGTEVVLVGGTSKGYQANAGSNVLSAQEVGGFTWSPATRDVPAGGTFTLVLTC